MATLNKPVGYECEFIDQVPEDYFCKLCKHVAREPTLLSCCGECFCKICVNSIIQDNKSCPSCGKIDFTSFSQPKYQAKILALEIRCKTKDRGCPWTGQLQILDAHLDVTTGDCEYVDVECPKQCDQKVQKHNVGTHLANECPNRDYSCPHCNFKANFRVVSDHFEVCPYYPLVCTNRCGVSFERDDLEDHMKMCRLEEVQCVFSSAGCEAKFIRDIQDEHMDQNTQKYLALIPAAALRICHDFERKLQEQQEVFEKKLENLQEQKDQQIKQIKQNQAKQSREFEERLGELQKEFQQTLGKKDTQIMYLEKQLQTSDKQQQQICREAGITPHDITFSNYQQVKASNGYTQSPPIYTHPGGYRFVLKVIPNGHGPCAGIHVTVMVYAFKSDHDAVLKFPGKFTITLQLLNQYRDQDHHTSVIQCGVPREDFGPWVYVGGDHTFILQTGLEWNCDKQTQYLKDDCLKCRITKIVVS